MNDKKQSEPTAADKAAGVHTSQTDAPLCPGCGAKIEDGFCQACHDKNTGKSKPDQAHP
ncbi:MAG: hypothetical protein KDE59_12780 [Anaerolineales bacterium]|nr:hypothetical protein [Anaerolineales bacterium]